MVSVIALTAAAPAWAGGITTRVAADDLARLQPGVPVSLEMPGEQVAALAHPRGATRLTLSAGVDALDLDLRPEWVNESGRQVWLGSVAGEPGSQVTLVAGGGTVADAKPEYEYEESVNKSKAVKGAIAVAASQRDWA